MSFNTQRLIREAEGPCPLESAVPKSFNKDRGGAEAAAMLRPDKPYAPEERSAEKAVFS
jgi:hypothetical protein